MRIPNDAELITFHDWTLRVRQPRSNLRAYCFSCTVGPAMKTRCGFLCETFLRIIGSLLRVRRTRPNQADIPGEHEPQPNTRGWPSLEDFHSSADALIALVDDYATQNQIDASQFDVIGFSQGAALTNAIALLYPERVRRAGVLAGFLPTESESIDREMSVKRASRFSSRMERWMRWSRSNMRANRSRCWNAPAHPSHSMKMKSAISSAQMACTHWKNIFLNTF